MLAVIRRVSSRAQDRPIRCAYIRHHRDRCPFPLTGRLIIALSLLVCAAGRDKAVQIHPSSRACCALPWSRQRRAKAR